MEVDQINNKNPLIISSSDHVINADLNPIIGMVTEGGFDASLLTFRSVHPKWSFVRLDFENKVIETAEKKPISSIAIAGLYCFQQGADFV